MEGLHNYFSLNRGLLTFSRAQSSAFAKEVAGDFNPIHNVDARRFCVPGDLLFAVFLSRYGVYQTMHFDFSGMVGDGVELVLPADVGNEFSLYDTCGKAYFDVRLGGDNNKEFQFTNALTKQYVQFSGQTFPHILVDLLRNNNVMINPDRPLVIYKSMSIALQELHGTAISLEPAHSSLAVDGKKGEAHLQFSICAEGKAIGSGEKSMVLSGLREYDQDQIDRIVNEYADRKAAYKNRQSA